MPKRYNDIDISDYWSSDRTINKYRQENKNFSQFLEDKFVKEKNSLNNEKSFAKGFSTATILYCVGAMSILGSINSGLTNDNTILNIKAILDGVISIVLTSIYGVGVIFSAVSVTIYQGIFYLLQAKLKII